LADVPQADKTVEPMQIPNPAFPEFRRKALLEVKGAIASIICPKITEMLMLSSGSGKRALFHQCGNSILC
jgi:hypothetical protein